MWVGLPVSKEMVHHTTKMREKIIHTILSLLLQEGWNFHLRISGLHVENVKNAYSHVPKKPDIWGKVLNKQREVLRVLLKLTSSLGTGMRAEGTARAINLIRWDVVRTAYEKDENNPCPESEVSINQSVITQHICPHHQDLAKRCQLHNGGTPEA